jgi:hypothetical protein
MTHLLFFALYTLGATYVVTESVIASPVRIALSVRSTWLDMLVHCAKCSAFWVGVLAPNLGIDPLGLRDTSIIAASALNGVAAVAVAMVGVAFGVLGNEDPNERELIQFLRDNPEPPDDQKLN